MNSAADPFLAAHFEAAAAAIRTAIAEGDGPLPPHFVVAFMLCEWRRYLALTRQEYGESSVEWRNALDTTQRLVLSLQAPANSADRARLTQSLPGLIADLKTGASLAGMPVAARDNFLATLREYHLRLIDPSSAPRPRRRGEDPSDTIALDTRDPRLRAVLDRLDGADGVEYIEM